MRRSLSVLRSRSERYLRLHRIGYKDFAAFVRRDVARFLLGDVKPVVGEFLSRERAAFDWICRAQDATPDDGVSYGFFPARYPAGWGPSYPETTGYIIPTLLDSGRPDLQDRAVRMAQWEAAVQMPNGAVQGGPLCPPEQQTPAVFNTGMVLQGYTAAFRFTQRQDLFEAARKAADFLVSDIGPDYHFQTHGSFVTADRKKTYNCLCAWALYRFGEDSSESLYCERAVKAAEAAAQEQQHNGWFANNDLENPDAPLTHTIGYTLQGVLEVGALANRRDLIEVARRGVDPLINAIEPNGFLRGRFRSDWTPAVRSCCLTGSAQIAIICYRLFEEIGDPKYRVAGDRLTNFLKGVQLLDSEMPQINGALAGSFPITGSYIYLGYPNWAAKYFIDALRLQQKHQS
jgi:hypothetical protein